jgi:hypothetical protein
MATIAALLAFLGVLTSSGPTWADTFFTFFDGNDLYEQCQGSHPHQSGMCTGYIIAATEGSTSEGNACVPTGEGTIYASQATDIVIRYLRDHPERRHAPAYSLVGTALSEVWPCR